MLMMWLALIAEGIFSKMDTSRVEMNEWKRWIRSRLEGDIKAFGVGRRIPIHRYKN